MSEFDDFDLGRRLRDAAGAEPDMAAARDRVQHRVTRARRRRVAAVSGAAAAVVVSIGLVASLGNEGGNRIDTADSGPTVSEIVPASTDGTSTTIVDDSTTIVPAGPTTTLAGAVPSTAPGQTTPSSPTTVPTVAPTSAPSAPPDDGSTTVETAPSSTGGDTTTTTPSIDETQPYNSLGGSIVVQLSGGQMTLVSTAAAAGYDTERHTEKPDDIEVRFRSADAESRIRVRLVNGQMVPEIDES